MEFAYRTVCSGFDGCLIQFSLIYECMGREVYQTLKNVSSEQLQHRQDKKGPGNFHKLLFMHTCFNKDAVNGHRKDQILYVLVDDLFCHM